MSKAEGWLTTLSDCPRALRAAIFQLALPAMGALFLRTVHQTINQFWVGRLGPQAQAAVAGSNFLIWLLFALGGLVHVGSQALVARSTGARRPGEVWEAARHSLVASVALALLVAPIAYALHPLIFTWQELETEVRRQAGHYYGIFLLGLPATYLLFTVGAIFRARGDTRTPFYSNLIAVLFNTGLDPFLIFGWGPFPRWGVAGSAVVTLFASLLNLAYLLRRLHSCLPAEAPPPVWRARTVQRLLRIGLPSALSGVVFSLIYVVLVKLLAPFGTAPVAALGIGHALESFSYLTSVGFSIAAATLVGQLVGAKQPRTAARAAWLCAWWTSAVLGTLGLIMLVFPRALAALFTANVDVIAAAALYLRTVALFKLVDGWEVVFGGSFSGAGDTLPPMIVGLAFTVLRIPLAWVLAYPLSLGVWGVWLAIGLTAGIKGLVIALWFRTGRWARVEV